MKWLTWILIAGLCLSAFVSGAKAQEKNLKDPNDVLQFSMLRDEDGRSVMLLWGAIDTDDEPRFLSYAKSHPESRAFWIASGGGDPHTAMEIGRLFRKTGLPVRVPSKEAVQAAIEREVSAGGNILSVGALAGWVETQPFIHCASACGYLLMGGRIRIVDREHSVGLHAARNSKALGYIATKDDAASQKQAYMDFERNMQNSVALKNEYIAEMSISQRFSQISSAVPAQCMYYLSASEMTAINLTNVNSMQTRGSSRGVCDCWMFERGDPRISQFQRTCEQSAASGVAGWTIE